ncbi:MAG: ribonuclease J [Clostridia bacterium]|nr:ribonuclease J [Clostridia bacterium]
MSKANTEKLRIIPLGGLGEIGKNLTVLEYGDDMIAIDCGLAFPDEDMLGIDMVIPDISYLETNKDKLRAFVITHGHEDHIGSLPYVLDKVKAPVIGTRFTLALIEHKLEEHNILDVMMQCIDAGDTVELGCFKIEFIKVSHSIAGAVALAVTTPVGVVIHTGDFKVDYTPIDDEPIDIDRFAAYGSEGVLALMMDSTNAELEGVTPSEKELGKTFEKVFSDAEGRVIVASFASNVYRIQQVIDTAVRHDRVVCFQGRSMVTIARIAYDLGYLKLPDNSVVDIDQLKNYDNNRICVLTTGSQGESMSGLFRMANANHKLIVGKGDTVIISASAIPGNEKSVGRVINQLFRRGANVIYDRLADVHVSGHARREELKLMFRLLKPKYFIPVHGETRHLYRHARLAEDMGINPGNVFVMENGNILEIDHKEAKLNGSVSSGSILVDGLGVGDIGTTVLRERRLLSQEGMFSIIIPVQKSTGDLIGLPEIITRGFIYLKDSDELITEAKQYAFDLSVQLLEKYRGPDWSAFNAAMKSSMKAFLLNKTKRTPIIVPIVVDIEL